jgi:hypothetical protein
MSLVKSPASCFIDAIEIALGCPADLIEGYYSELSAGDRPDVDGYHSSLVQMVLLEQFGIGLSEIDISPSQADGTPMDPCVTDRVVSWFSRPGFRCVATGINRAGTAHAVAFYNGSWIDPARDTLELLDEPPIQMAALWVMSIPKNSEVFADDDQTESED